VKVREQIWVGIDVGKMHHHACAVDASGKVVFSRRLANGQAEIEALIARVAKAAQQVRWALDMTSGTAGLLLAVLRRAQATVVYVPGRLVNRMAGAFAGEGSTSSGRCCATAASSIPHRRSPRTRLDSIIETPWGPGDGVVALSARITAGRRGVC
jgi:hypothetical protein